MKAAGVAARVPLLLWLGFGGLIGLLIVIGVSALSILHALEVHNEDIRQGYLQRTRLLDQLRSNIYLSGTYVRDYLLEDNADRAAGYARKFQDIQRQADVLATTLAGTLPSSDEARFRNFQSELSSYFDALKSVFRWTPEQRATRGREFMRDEVTQRRLSMIGIADEAEQMNERQLESGTRLIEDLFGQFRLGLFGLLLLTVAIGCLLAAFSMNRMFRLERETERRYAELELARRESQALSARLLDAQEEERRKLSRELHDEVGQSLAALLLGLGNLAAQLSADEPIKQQMQMLRTLAESSVAAVRHISLLLRPSMLDDLGLVAALQWKVREVERSSAMRVNITADETADDLPEEYATAIYRIVQEALNNCQRHAAAEHVQVELRQINGTLRLSIQDNGKGFYPRHRGLGLLGIEERVTRLGGQFRIDSNKEQGTLLEVELPLTQ